MITKTVRNKLLFSVIIFLSVNSIRAQTNEGSGYDHMMKDHPIRFGIKAGLSRAAISASDDATIDDNNAVAGWMAGIYTDVPLLPVLSFQPGLLLVSKGSKLTFGDDGGSNYTQMSVRPLYLEIPLNVLVKIPLPNKVKLFAGAGPYIAFGIAGKSKFEGKLLGVSFSEKEKIVYGDEDQSATTTYSANIKRLDVGANLIAGLEISHFTLNANYGYGITDIRAGVKNDDAKYKNRIFSISVGLLF